MGRRTKRALPALTRRITLAALALWLACMCAITAVTAESLYVNFYSMGKDFMENVRGLARFDESLGVDAPTLPGFTEYVLWQAIMRGGMGNNYEMLDREYSLQVLDPDRIKADYAVAVFDADGSALAYPSNFFKFAYSHAEEDVIDDLPPDGYAVCVLDKQMDAETARFRIEQAFLMSSANEALRYRFTGVLEDGYLTIKTAEVLRNPLMYEQDEDWIELLGFACEIPEDAETVTLYTRHVDAWVYRETRAFKYNGGTVNGLDEFLLEFGPLRDRWQVTSFGFTDFVYEQALYHYEPHESEDWYGEPEDYPQLRYKIVGAMLASPWGSAVSALRNVYLITLLVAIVGIARLRHALSRDVTEPVLSIIRGTRSVTDTAENPARYTEIAELLTQYDETRAQLAQNADDITRLERAAKYAQEAEKKRRELTSNIAHELKTPLAVIHSYAEGLTERIAEDKRDKYLGVILSEAERMDGMVLEMLELSRLEAGRVKLFRESFSLSEMAALAFERLELAVGAKDLKISLELAEQCDVHADPMRIEQVITNFAANAVKYTPLGGSIQVRTDKRWGKVTFSVENDSPPLSSEALLRVWDSFYRADEARSGMGTGLGLSIAKSIIELHGGTCLVRNTQTGIEFSFTI